MDTCIYMVELLCCPPEITTTLLISYTIFYFYKMKSFKKRRRDGQVGCRGQVTGVWTEEQDPSQAKLIILQDPCRPSFLLRNLHLGISMP